jgi:uncharacterized membrane protein
MRGAVKQIRGYATRLVWALDDSRRAMLCFAIGMSIFWLGRHNGWGWEIPFLSAWNVAVAAYLALLGVIVFTARSSETRERAASVNRAELSLLVVLVLVIILGVLGVGDILTAVGERPSPETRLLVALSVIAVVLSWLLLHTAFAQHYARLYYDVTDASAGARRGFIFPDTPDPAYEDFIYLAFTIGLTYATSDVSITHAAQRRAVFSHSLISFFFYSTALGVVLNAVVTS